MFQFFQKFAKFNRDHGQKGIAIYLAVATLSIVLAIALGVGALSSGRLKMLNEASNSVTAFAVAETGIEWALLNVTSEGYVSPAPVHLGDATYVVTSYKCGVANDFLCIKSVGVYHNAQRAIKVSQ